MKLNAKVVSTILQGIFLSNPAFTLPSLFPQKAFLLWTLTLKAGIVTISFHVLYIFHHLQTSMTSNSSVWHSMTKIILFYHSLSRSRIYLYWLLYNLIQSSQCSSLFSLYEWQLTSIKISSKEDTLILILFPKNQFISLVIIQYIFFFIGEGA